MSQIDNFDGEHRWLSNFSTEGGVKPTVEHHYQAAKTLNVVERGLILESPTPGKAKKAGQKVALRPDWEEIKLWVMFELLLEKFAEPAIQAKLLATGSALLIEGNHWGDTFWGVCKGKGENWLGRQLELVRSFYATLL